MNLQPKRTNFDEVWHGLKQSVEFIVNLQPIQRTVWDSNFSIPESHSKRLYRALSECLEEHTRRIKENLESLASEQLLKDYNAEWRKYHKGAEFLERLFGYLNRQLKKEHDNQEAQHTFLPLDPAAPQKSVGAMAFAIWKSEVIEPLSPRLVSFLISIIEATRRGESVPTASDACNVIASFVEVNESFDTDSSYPSNCIFTAGSIQLTEFYQPTFETPFLRTTEDYYKGMANVTFSGLGCSEYMEAVLHKMVEEKARARKFLHQSSFPKIDALLTKHLVEEQMSRFRDESCWVFITTESAKDLHNMYVLLKPLPGGLSILASEFEQHIKNCGMAASKQAQASGQEQAAQYVANIDSLRNKFDKMILEIFNADELFHNCLDKALQYIINHREDPKQPPRVSERLNRYIDSLLRRSLKGQNESEVEDALAKAVMIFRHVDDKDLFMKYYAKMLCNRLISSLSISMELEEQMITRMKEACGYEFTSKLTRMFTDITLSAQLTEKFNEELAKKKEKLPVHTTFMVLQAGAWPLCAPTQFQSQEAPQSSSQLKEQQEDGNYAPPSSLQEAIEHFVEFYSATHNGRRLAWLYANSSADIKLNYLDKAYIAWMSAYQVSILLTFEHCDSLTTAEASANSGLDYPTFLRNVRGLLDMGILSAKEDQSLVESSVLHLNKAFTSKRLRLKVGMPPIKPKEEREVDSACCTLQQDRKYYMECTLVRIMKARKVMRHASLVDEVIKQTSTRFLPDVVFIKKVLESLIEKLYIQRTSELDEYQYLA